MTTSIAAPVVSTSENAFPELSAAERRQRWFEVCLVLLVALGAFILSSLYVLVHGPSAFTQLSNLRAASGLLQESAALLVLGYVLSRRGMSFAHLGFRWSLRDVRIGLLLMLLAWIAYAFGSVAIQVVHRVLFGAYGSGPRAQDFFAHPPVLFIPFSLLNPFFEELIVRAYLMTEVIELTRSRALAVALSVGIQFLYHLYYGLVGAVSVSFFFLVLALYYLRSRKALPVIVAHAFVDIYALIRLW